MWAGGPERRAHSVLKRGAHAPECPNSLNSGQDAALPLVIIVWIMDRRGACKRTWATAMRSGMERSGRLRTNGVCAQPGPRREWMRLSRAPAARVRIFTGTAKVRRYLKRERR